MCTVVVLQLNQGHSKAVHKFFLDIYTALKLHINFSIIKAVLVGR